MFLLRAVCLLRYQLEENHGIGREGSDLGQEFFGRQSHQIDQRQPGCIQLDLLLDSCQPKSIEFRGSG